MVVDDIKHSQSTRVALGNCRFCLPRCGVEVTIGENDRVISVIGDKSHPHSKGYLCPKGSQIPWAHNRPDRLNYPELDGKRVSWDDALDDLADKIKAAIAIEGPEAVGFYLASGVDILGATIAFTLAGALSTSQVYTAATVDVAPSMKAAEMVTGSASFVPHWEESDEDVKLFLLFGSNSVVSHGYAGAAALSNVSERLRLFQARGGKVWVFDPIYTRTAELADGYGAPIPGTDAVVLAWLAREILARMPDNSPVREKTKPEALQRLSDALSGFELDAVAKISGIDELTLQRLLQDVLAAGRIVFPAGTGMSFGPHGLLCEWLRWVLLIVTDSLEEPGGMWFDPGWQSKLDELEQWNPVPEEGIEVPAPRSRPDLPRYFGQTACVAMNDEIERGPLRVLFVFGGNPLTAIPQPERTAAAFKSLDALAVLDVVPSELTDAATHVLPCTGALERLEISGTLVTPYRPTLTPPSVKPVAERKHSWYIFMQVAQRLGVWEHMFGHLDPDTTTEEDIARLFVSTSRHTFDEMVEAGPHGVTYNTRKRWMRERAVPEGKWRVAPQALLDRLPSLLIDPRDENYPLLLICGRQERRHNRASNVSNPAKAEQPFLKVSAEDAIKYDLTEGDWVMVRSRNGEVRAQATIKPNIRPGAVQLPHAWPQANVENLMTSIEVDSLTTQPQMSAVAVSIERIVDHHMDRADLVHSES